VPIVEAPSPDAGSGLHDAFMRLFQTLFLTAPTARTKDPASVYSPVPIAVTALLIGAVPMLSWARPHGAGKATGSQASLDRSVPVRLC
jgi:hypothetical protein